MEGNLEMESPSGDHNEIIKVDPDFMPISANDGNPVQASSPVEDSNEVFVKSEDIDIKVESVEEDFDIESDEEFVNSCEEQELIVTEEGDDPIKVDDIPSVSSDKEGFPTDLEKAVSHMERQWYKQCIYGCKVCKKVYTSSSAATVHSNKKHKGQRGTTVRLLTNHWKCHLCHREIICDLSNLKNHLRSAHKVTISKYEDVFIPKSKRGRLHREASIKRHKGSDTLEGLDSHERIWYNQCSFKCSACSKYFVSYLITKWHVQHVHKFGNANVTRVKTKLWECKICSGKVNWDYVAISMHLRKKHERLTVAEYAEKYVPKEVNEEEEAEVKANIENLEDILGAGPSAVAEAKAQTLLQKLEPVKREWYDKCTWKCPYCPVEFICYRHSRTHITTIHKLKMIGECHRVHTVYWECQLCHGRAIADLRDIRGHLRRKHKMGVEEYAGKFPDTLNDALETKKKKKPRKDYRKIKAEAEASNVILGM